ncbi:CHAT domain-containing protein [Candidatus Gracilibacteria bacterium]|nr:CHAT domain-containing protein [Candidatus Gracilibacteria bacterium]NJM88399.1 CHAT domain-containing protein [Hydrococcus sp. RU_2_2]NJP21417.1 CHAT domain-containing protein [Hydrococcus sp. CRU_1_1]
MRRLPIQLSLLVITLLFASAIAPVSQSSESHFQSFISQPSDLLEQGKQFYEGERYQDAIAIWQEAISDFEKQGDLIGQAGALNHLSLAYQALGQWQQAKGAIDKSLNLLQRSPTKETKTLAQALNIQGYLQSRTGQTQAALESWQQAEATYREADDKVGVIGSQINQAQALQSLGLYRRANNLLSELHNDLRSQTDSTLKVKGLKSLGVIRQLTGSLQESKKILEESLAIAQRLKDSTSISEILFSLGNVERDLQEPQKALNYYQQAAKSASGSSVELEAQLNQLSLYIKLKQYETAIAHLAPIEAKITKLTPSRTSINAGINFAESLSKLAALQPEREKETFPHYKTAAAILARGIKQAQSLGDRRGEANALTQLGKLYEQGQQNSDALQLTQKALQIAQQIEASDIAARAAWQWGRLLERQGDRQKAIAAYEFAFNELQVLRRDLVAINPEVQLSFTETVEPVYREYVALLLSSNVNQENLKKAREIIEALQQAELENFFREACLDTKPVAIDEVDKQAAAIYPIILRDRLEVIVSLPNQPIRHYTTHLPQSEIEKHLQRMRQSLNPAFSNQERLKLSQQAYQWLIQPAQSDLERLKIKTLVFVLDGYLRNLPMAALHDGEQYLVEKYNIALSLGLQLLNPRPIQSIPLQTIAAGLSLSSQGFPPLPGVRTEVTQISSKLESKVLLDRDFTNNNLKNAISSTPAPIVHLATHGQFSSNAEDTFVLTWDGRINVKELDSLLQVRDTDAIAPIELLVLSACQTASGDNRAVLGLAGVAVRSGARSTLATLWSVRDDSTVELMSEFYKQLKQPGITKAEALRQAQLALLRREYDHPVYWAAFVLVGNWL